MGSVGQMGIVGIALSVLGAKKRWYQQRYQEKTSMGKVALGWYGKIRKAGILILFSYSGLLGCFRKHSWCRRGEVVLRTHSLANYI